MDFKKLNNNLFVKKRLLLSPILNLRMRLEKQHKPYGPGGGGGGGR